MSRHRHINTFFIVLLGSRPRDDRFSRDANGRNQVLCFSIQISTVFLSFSFSFFFILFFLVAGLLSLFPVIVSVSLSVCLCICLLARFIFLPLVSEARYALETHETGLCMGHAVGISTRWRFRYSGRSFNSLSCGNVKNAAGTINLHHQIMTPVKAVLIHPIETNSCARSIVLTNFQ